ncbi:hypothetical protein [Sinorhizobium meliloti]|uniref:hypothetical protein n=1 Tax=Rhizobium meliloti TaxID=382 RepID=UPI000414031C|nr:hypothetical protein [Sinorhizobium meliloti]
MTVNPEARLKKLAKESGFTVSKSNGGYLLACTATGNVIAGDKHPLSLQGLAVELQRLHVLGR